MSVAVTTPVPTPSTTAPARRPKLRTERLSARVSSAGLNVAVVALTLAWIVPTLGLLINSFRQGGAFNTSGWWTALAPPFNFTLDSYRAVLGASDLVQPEAPADSLVTAQTRWRALTEVRLAVLDGRRVNDTSAEGFGDHLVAETHAEERRARLYAPPDELTRAARIGRTTGTG